MAFASAGSVRRWNITAKATPVSFAAAIILSAALTFSASGFSESTCRPAFMQSTAMAGRTGCGVAIITASHRPDLIRSLCFAKAGTPNFSLTHLAVSGSMSHIAVSCASGIFSIMLQWPWPMPPVPMMPKRTTDAIVSTSCGKG
ncbi:MAG: hypothetical protein BWY76_02322 [bacterium ADurb.Bin429]|nr:MAG: hypothetical protein BWY76_02322 [bacterium ADurb.Bin429]